MHIFSFTFLFSVFLGTKKYGFVSNLSRLRARWKVIGHWHSIAIHVTTKCNKFFSLLRFDLPFLIVIKANETRKAKKKHEIFSLELINLNSAIIHYAAKLWIGFFFCASFAAGMLLIIEKKKHSFSSSILLIGPMFMNRPGGGGGGWIGCLWRHHNNNIVTVLPIMPEMHELVSRINYLYVSVRTSACVRVSSM